MFSFKTKSENSKIVKFYEITYETSLFRNRYKSIVTGLDELQAIDNFRKIGTSQEVSDIVDIKPYKVGEGD